MFRRENFLVFTDPGVMIFFFALPLAYPIVYTLIYNPEVVREIPTVVVDGCRSAESRSFVRSLSATPTIRIVGYAADLAEAREALASKRAYGVIEIPADFSRRLGRGEQAVATFRCDMSLLIRYRQYLTALTDVQMAETMEITAERLASGGITSSGLPVLSQAHFMGDVTQGFASFIMPGLVVLILQQSMILGIAMMAGTSADRRRRAGVDPLAIGAPASATVIGRTLCHVMIYLPLAYYILEIVPAIFSLPHVGRFLDYMPLALAVLMASSLLGQCIGLFVRERETCLLVVVFTSVVFLFLSGLTWPHYAFSPFWRGISALIPATWGIEGMVHINSDGATLAETRDCFLALWALCALYFAAAWTIRRATAPAAPAR